MEEGNKYLSEGNYQGAIVIYKTVLENSPENMDARLALGKAYLGAGKMDQAEKNFEKYLRQNPYDKAVLLDMGKLAAFRKDNKVAVDYLKKYVAEYPNSSEGYELLGKNYWQLGERELTKASFEKAMEVDPNGPTPKLAMAQYYVALGDPDTARTYIDSILNIDPANREALHYRAREELSAGNVEAYQTTLKTLLQNHPDDAYAKYSLAKSYVAQKKYEEARQLGSDLRNHSQNTGYGQRIDGLLKYTQKDYKGAIDSYLESISIRPDLESYLYLGLSQYGAGDLETAISNLRIAADRAPKMVKAREMISLILFQQKRYSESIAEAEKVLEVDPNNVIARVIKGDVYTAQGDREKALEQLKEVTDMDPTYAAAFMKMGVLHYQQGDIAESEAALKDAVDAAPTSLRPRLVLSDFYRRNGDKARAKKVLEEGLTGDRADVGLYSYLARMELAERHPEKARELLERAKKADEISPVSYMMLASMDISEKKPEAALAEYDALLVKIPDNLQALMAKASILDALDRNAEAEAAYDEGIKSGNPRAYLAYAGSKRKAGDGEGALAIIQAGLAKNAFYPELVKAKADTLFSLKRFDEVLVMCDEIEEVNREAGMTLRVRTYMLMKDLEKAVATARQLCEIDPKNPRSYLILADVYRSSQQADEWGKILEEGVAKSGPDSNLLLELSRYYAYRGDYNKALTYLDSVIKSNDKYFSAYSMQGDVYTQLGRTEKAVDSYNKALDINENYVPALNNLAMIYLNDPKTSSEALRLAYKAYLQVPWNPSIMDTFGYALAVNDKSDAAVTLLEKAVTVEADNPVINYHLGYAYLKAGKKEQAAAKLKLVAECNDCENAADAQKLLKTLSD